MLEEGVAVKPHVIRRGNYEITRSPKTVPPHARIDIGKLMSLINFERLEGMLTGWVSFPSVDDIVRQEIRETVARFRFERSGGQRIVRFWLTIILHTR